MGNEALIERAEREADRGEDDEMCFPVALVRELAAALKAAEAALPDPLAHYQAQQEAAGRYGFERGGLQSAWRALQRTDKAELEWAIVDALGMGGIAAWPGDGVGCAARIVEAQIDRAEKAEADLAAARAEIAKLKEDAAYIGELHQQEQESMVELAAVRAENDRLREDAKCVVVALEMVAEFLAGGNPLHTSGGHRNTDLRGEVAAAIALLSGKAT